MPAAAGKGDSGYKMAIIAAAVVMPGLTRQPPGIPAGKVSLVGPGSGAGATVIKGKLEFEK